MSEILEFIDEKSNYIIIGSICFILGSAFAVLYDSLVWGRSFSDYLTGASRNLPGWMLIGLLAAGVGYLFVRRMIE